MKNKSSGHAQSSPQQKSALRRWKQKLSISALLCLVFLTFFSVEAEASHYRYGNISWTWVSGRTVTFHISQAYRRTFYPGPPNVGSVVNTETLQFGDGTTATIPLTINSVNTTEDWFFGEATITHTFLGTANTFTTFYASNARVSTLINNSNLQYRSQTVVTLGAGNSSPASTMPPIINIQDGQASTSFNIPAVDPNGGALSYRFATAAEMGATGSTQPPNMGMTVNSTTGVVSFSTTHSSITVNQLYNAAFVVTDASGATTMLDVILKVVTPSTPPVFDYSLTPANGFTYNLQPGQNVSFTVKAQDTDPGNTVSLNAVGVPTGATLTPSLPVTGAGLPGVQTAFSWTPNSSQLGTRVVNFIAQDNLGNQTTTTVTIIVSLDPVFDVPPTLALGAFTCLETGVPYSTDIQATAPDPLVDLRITSATTMTGVSYSPSIPTTWGNTSSTTLSWTPTPSQWGVHHFSFTATDDQSHFTNHSYDFAVNSIPYFTAPPTDVTISENQPYSVTVTFDDADLPYGDYLNAVIPSLPSWLTLTQTNSNTAILSGTPGAGDVGTHHLHFELEDSFHHCFPHVDEHFHIEVEPCAFTASITPSATGTQCPGASVTLTANTADSYLWSNGATTQSITVTASGTNSYSVTSVDGYCSSSASATVVGADNTAPVPDVSTLADATGDCSVTVTAPTATDNCAGTITGTTSDPTSYTAQGTYSITWTYDDGNGNSTTQTQTVIVDDNTAPVPTNATLATVTGECSASVAAPTATDNCAGTVTGTTSDPTSYSVQGTYSITWTYDDGNGNTSTQTQTVIVDDNTAPVPTNATLATVTGECSASVTAPTATDNCAGTLTATTSDPTSYTAQGTYSITWTYDDGNGNTTTQTQSVIVDDVTAPVPDDATLETVTGECSASVTAPTATDNCAGTLTATTSDPTSYTAQGTYSITWTYDDGNGNTTTQTQSVVVDDVTAPTVTAPANVTITEWCTNVPASNVTLGTPATGDNCSIVSTTNDAPASYPVGTTTVTWTVTDIGGNVTTATQTVTVTNITLAATSAVSPQYPFPGQELHTIYLGYTPQSAQSVTISATPTNGTSPYTYSWQRSGCNNSTFASISGTGSSQTFSPNSTFICSGTGDNVYQYIVTITDAHGCVTTQQKNVNVVDPFSGNKIRVCHVPPGDPGNAHVITISANAVATHLAHGDYLGNCFNFSGRQAQEEEAGSVMETISEEMHFHVYPNPSTGIINVELPVMGTTDVIITDISGRLVRKQTLKDNTQHLLSFDLSAEAKGLYFVRFSVGGEVFQSKVSIQ